MPKYIIKVNIEREIEAGDKEQALTNFFEGVEDYNAGGISGCDIIEDNLEIIEITTPRKNEQRVAICEYTKKKVVQEWTGNEWICLHNAGRTINGKELNKKRGAKLDKKEVEKFETK